MSGHVIGALRAMGVERIAIWGQALQPCFEIQPCTGVGVFLEHQARRGVAQEDRAKAGDYMGARNASSDRGCDLKQAAAGSVDRQGLLVDGHAARLMAATTLDQFLGAGRP